MFKGVKRCVASQLSTLAVSAGALSEGYLKGHRLESPPHLVSLTHPPPSPHRQAWAAQWRLQV